MMPVEFAFEEKNISPIRTNPKDYQNKAYDDGDYYHSCISGVPKEECDIKYSLLYVPDCKVYIGF